MKEEIFYDKNRAWASCEEMEVGNYSVTFEIRFNRMYDSASYYDPGYDELEVDCVEIESVYEWNDELNKNVEITDEEVIKSLKEEIACNWDSYCE